MRQDNNRYRKKLWRERLPKKAASPSGFVLKNCFLLCQFLIEDLFSLVLENVLETAIDHRHVFVPFLFSFSAVFFLSIYPTLSNYIYLKLCSKNFSAKENKANRRFLGLKLVC